MDDRLALGGCQELDDESPFGVGSTRDALEPTHEQAEMIASRSCTRQRPMYVCYGDRL